MVRSFWEINLWWVRCDYDMEWLRNSDIWVIFWWILGSGVVVGGGGGGLFGIILGILEVGLLLVLRNFYGLLIWILVFYRSLNCWQMHTWRFRRSNDWLIHLLPSLGDLTRRWRLWTKLILKIPILPPYLQRMLENPGFSEIKIILFLAWKVAIGEIFESWVFWSVS